MLTPPPQPPASRGPADVVARFVAAFNATMGRRVSPTPEIESKAAALLKAGYRPWQIVALPILVDANGIDPTFRRKVSPATMLRDGKHPRTGEGGRTTGATHWLERELQRLDRTTLDPRLESIAQQFEVLDQLMQAGVAVQRGGPGTA